MKFRGPYRTSDGERRSPCGAAIVRGILVSAGLAIQAWGAIGGPAPQLTARQLAHNLKTKSFSGAPVELRLGETGLTEILAKLEEVSGLKFKIAAPLPLRKVSFTFLGQAWDKALDTILTNSGLELRLEGDDLIVDVFRPEADRSIPAFLIGTVTAAALLGGLALEHGRRKRRRRNRDRERRILLAPDAAEEILHRLNSLFRVEKIHRNSRLSLDSLADRLSVQPYQLSGIINGRLNRTFSDLLADFRVEEVKKRLSDPEETSSILNIAYDAGFGTKAAFNRVFKERTGLTPSEFKKKALSPRS